ncbi:MAG: hypothetical protein JSW71_23935 [Gemmatimonadota bacterium]|nr:MAG: hypothetical protein JSW71_23935 [Gemmatimonadota bacterium]
MSEDFQTPVTFSREEIAEIRVMLSTWSTPTICPRCKGDLTVEQQEAEELRGRIYLACRACNRMAFISRHSGGGSSDR